MPQMVNSAPPSTPCHVAEPLAAGARAQPCDLWHKTNLSCLPVLPAYHLLRPATSAKIRYCIWLHCFNNPLLYLIVFDK